MKRYTILMAISIPLFADFNSCMQSVDLLIKSDIRGAYNKYKSCYNEVDSKKALIRFFGSMAITAKKLGKKYEAGSYLDRLRTIDPKNSWVKRTLKRYIHKGIELNGKLYPINNETYQDYINKANNFNDNNQLSLAYINYLKALSMASSKRELKKALGALAVVSNRLNRVDEAKEYINRILKIFPNNKWAINYINKIGRGNTQYSKNNTDISIVSNISSKPSNSSLTQPTILWQKNFYLDKYDNVFAITTKDDGGYILAGETYTGAKNQYDIYLINIDKDGNKIWQKTFGGSKDDVANSITKTDDGGFIVAGWTESFGNRDADGYLIKIDKDGNKIWQKTFGGSKDDIVFSIVKTDEGYIIYGLTQSFGIKGNGLYLIKIDKDGNEIWQKAIAIDKNIILSIFDRNVISKTNDGGLIFVGTSFFVNGDSTINLIKFDKSGNKVWQKIFSESKGDIARTIVKTDDGFIVAGSRYENGDTHALLLKFYQNGNKIWDKTFKNIYCLEANLIIRSNSDFVFAGTKVNMNDPVCVVKFKD